MSDWREQEAREQKEREARAMASALQIIERQEREKATRADSKDGLVMTVTRDDAGRAIKTFKNVGPRKVWMDEYRGPGLKIEKFVKDFPGGDLTGLEYVRQGSQRFDVLMRGVK
jgi:hypothetical protein